MFVRLDEIMSKCKDDAFAKSTVSKFYANFYNKKAFIDYLVGNWFDANRIFNYTYSMFMFFYYYYFPFQAFVILVLHFFFVGMWAKWYIKFPHSNQEINSATESYHYTLKTRFLCQKARKYGRRMNLLLTHFLN